MPSLNYGTVYCTSCDNSPLQEVGEGSLTLPARGLLSATCFQARCRLVHRSTDGPVIQSQQLLQAPCLRLQKGRPKHWAAAIESEADAENPANLAGSAAAGASIGLPGAAPFWARFSLEDLPSDTGSKLPCCPNNPLIQSFDRGLHADHTCKRRLVRFL